MRVLSAIGLLLPLAAAAQAPARYRVTLVNDISASPLELDQQMTLLKARGGDVSKLVSTKGENIYRSSAIVTVTVSDSGGGQVWRVGIDSLVERVGALNAAEGMTGRISPSLPNKAFAVFVKEGTPVAQAPMGADWRPISGPAGAMLQLQFPGLALLLPGPTIPAEVGKTAHQEAVMTSARPLPAMGNQPASTVQKTDRYVMDWTRTSALLAEAKVTREQKTITPASDNPNTGNGWHRISYNAAGHIQEVTSRIETTGTTVQATATTPATTHRSVVEFKITRMP